MKTMSTNSLRTILLTAVLSAAALAQLPGADSARQVSILVEGAELRVQIASTIPLDQVLNAFCSQQRIQCAGTESLSSFPVPSMSIAGSEEEIIADLLQGTGMNYSISRTDTGARSRLTLLGHASSATEYARGASGLNDGNTHAAQRHQDSQVSEVLTEEVPESAEESERSERVMQAIFSGASNGEGQNPGSGTNVASASGTTQAANSTLPEYLPFPDQFGNPIRTSPAALPTVLPFPDHNGNPIPVVPMPVHGPPIPLTSN